MSSGAQVQAAAGPFPKPGSFRQAYTKALRKSCPSCLCCAGPSLMPGGSREAYKYIEDIVKKAAAQVDDGPCVTYIGDGGAGEA